MASLPFSIVPIVSARAQEVGGARGGAEEAYRLVLTEGVPFREAYRRVAGRLGGERGPQL